VTPTAATVFGAGPSRMDAARVLRVIDGDTIVVTLGRRTETVRLCGIDATEGGDTGSAEATERVPWARFTCSRP
jgi:endonuclease YncB( thermonuclease family)